MKIGNFFIFPILLINHPKKGFSYILFEKSLTSKKWKANGLYITHMAPFTYRKNSS